MKKIWIILLSVILFTGCLSVENRQTNVENVKVEYKENTIYQHPSEPDVLFCINKGTVLSMVFYTEPQIYKSTIKYFDTFDNKEKIRIFYMSQASDPTGIVKFGYFYAMVYVFKCKSTGNFETIVMYYNDTSSNQIKIEIKGGREDYRE